GRRRRGGRTRWAGRPPRRASSAERVAQPRADAVPVAVAAREVGLLLTAQRGELAQQLGLLRVELGGHDDLDVHHQVAVAVDAAGGAQPRHALPAQGAHGARLGARLDVQLLDAVEGGQRQRGAQRGGRHRQLHRAVQVGAVAGEQLVRLLLHLHVEVAGRAAAGADLALAGQPDPHPVGDARRDAHGDLAPRPHASVAAALAARLRDHLAEAPAVRARPRGDDLAEERALHALHLAAAVADVAHGGAAARGAAGTAALAAEDGGVDGEVAGDALRALLEGEPHPDQRVGAGLHAAARAAPAPAALAAEEGVHDVAEAEGAERVARGAGPGA